MNNNEKKPENPSAFPTQKLNQASVNGLGATLRYDLQTVGGMTLRNYFAAKAMVGLLSSNPVINTEYSDDALSGAKIAFDWADAMLLERSKHDE